MAERERGETMDKAMDSNEEEPTKRARETHSGTPNSVNPNQERNTEHKSGYGGEGGDPRTSSDKRKPEAP